MSRPFVFVSGKGDTYMYLLRRMLKKISNSSSSSCCCSSRMGVQLVWKKRRVLDVLMILLSSSSSSSFLQSSSSKKRRLQTAAASLQTTNLFASSSSSSSPFLSLPPQRGGGEHDGDATKWIKCEAESNFWRSVYKKVEKNNDDDDDDTSSSHQDDELPSIDTLDSNGPLPPGAYYRSSSSKKDMSSSAKPTCRISLAIDISDENKELDASEMVKTMQSCLEDGLTSFQLSLTCSSTSSSSSEEQQQWIEENIYQRLLTNTPVFALRQCHLTIPFFLQHHGGASSSTIGKQQRPSTTPNMRMQSTLKMVRQHVTESLLRMGGAESMDCLQLIQSQDDDQGGDQNHLYHLDVLDAIQDLQREGLVQSVSLVPSRYSIENPSALSSWRTMGDGTSLWNNNVVDSIQMPINLLEHDDAIAFYRFLEQQQQRAQNDNNKRMRLPAILASSPLAGGIGFLTDRFVHDESENLSLQFLGSERFAFEDYVRATTTSATISKEEMSSLWNHYQNKILPALTEIAWKHGVSSISCISLRWLLQCQQNSNIHVASAVVPTSLMMTENNESNGNHYYKRNGRFRQRRSKSLYKQLRDVFTFQLDEEDLEQLSQLSRDFTALKPSSKKGWRQHLVDPMHAEWLQEDPESYYREMMMDNNEVGGDYSDDERMKIDFKNPKLWL